MSLLLKNKRLMVYIPVLLVVRPPSYLLGLLSAANFVEEEGKTCAVFWNTRFKTQTRINRRATRRPWPKRFTTRIPFLTKLGYNTTNQNGKFRGQKQKSKDFFLKWPMKISNSEIQ
jgi:hypothetical protein